MLTLNDAFYRLKQSLEPLYDGNEAAAIAHELLNHLTGLSKYERIIDKEKILDHQQTSSYTEATGRLLNGEPLQYVIGKQWFMGNVFEVNEHVLIPRPETEELVQWVVDEWKEKQTVSILDIGTGSGCIPVSLQLLMPAAHVSSADVSEEALLVAERNALKYGAEIELLEVDFLNEGTWEFLDRYDVIISNPPYIPVSEKEQLDKNVRDYEPGLALFVPDTDALLFYKKIASFARTHLRQGGAVYCEVHKAHARETRIMFEQVFKDVTLRTDMHDNERMIRCSILFPSVG